MPVIHFQDFCLYYRDARHLKRLVLWLILAGVAGLTLAMVTYLT